MRNLVGRLALLSTALLFTAVGYASTIVSASAGPGTNLSASSQLTFDVVGTATVTFDLDFSGGPDPDQACVEAALCYGGVGWNALLTQVISNMDIAELDVDGPLPLGSSQFDVEYFPFCPTNNFPLATTCTVSLNPGAYVLSVSLTGDLAPVPGSSGAVVLPFSQSVTSTFTVDSGTVIITPEPATALLFAGGMLALLVLFRTRISRSSVLKEDQHA